MGKNSPTSYKYVFLKNWNEFKKGEVVYGVEKPAEKAIPGAQYKKALRAAGVSISAHRKNFFIPKTEIGKTIKKVDDSTPTGTKPPIGGTITGGTTTETQSGLFTTKNIVLGVAFLAIGYFVYTKFIKKGKGK